METQERFRSAAVAILKKDARLLYPVLLLTALLQAIAIVTSRLDVWPILTSWMPMVLVIANSLAIFSIIQTDPPVSLTDDWLCRPVPRSALLFAKLTMMTVAIYVPRVLTTLAMDLLQGIPLTVSLLDSLLLQDPFALLFVPIVLMAAVCTSNMLQGFGVLIALFAIIFIVPTPFVSLPGPESTTLGETLFANGFEWIGMLSSKLIFIVAATLCLWAAYARRAVAHARLAFIGGTAAGLLAILAPMFLVSWPFTFGLQRTVSASASSGLEPAVRHAFACFPAIRLSDPAATGSNDNGTALFALHRWGETRLKEAGEDAIAFATQVIPHGLPDEWRLHVAYAQATYRIGDERALIRLRPAAHTAMSFSSLDGETLAHAWLLPQSASRVVAERSDALDIDYSVAVLEPTTAQLPVDGEYRRLPDIGTCRAKRDALDERILVDCLAYGRQPAMLSAELDGVPASRVDTGRVDYAPWLLRTLTAWRTELAVGMPHLVESGTIKITAYRSTAFTTVRARTKGVLGDTLTTCPLPKPESAELPRVSSWNDRSPHEIKAVEVENNVQVEVLDWGGSGKTLVLLPGLGATAHSFDELAPLLSKHFRVVGITRRGVGYSSRPDHGYDQRRLAEDVIRVLDALEIPRAVFVGHSIGGEELNMLGVHHADRVAALVYLDAAYDRSTRTSTRYRELSASLPDAPRPTPEELSSYAALQRFFDRTGLTALPEGELIAVWNVGKRYLAGQRSIDARVVQAIEAGLSAPDYGNINTPALALYATSAGPDGMVEPWHDRSDAVLLQTLHELQAMRDQRQRREIDKFRTELEGARVLEISGASHWIMLSHRDRVAQAIIDFIAEASAT
jgi:pimeloyl-ACP methyl ester carboxylesterase